jgi:hypothetical protein
MHMNYYLVKSLLVDASILTVECFMDRLINFMNNNRYPPPPIISLSTNYKPLTYPIFSSFLTPCSEIDYNQENFYVKVDENGSVLGGLQ